METPEKKMRLNESNSQSEDENDDNKQDDCNCTLTYDIWRLIFKYLNGRDLCTASMVCRTWKEAIESELALHAPSYLLTKTSELKSCSVENVIEKIRVRPRLAICFCENNTELADSDPEYCLCSRLPRACDVFYIASCLADLYIKIGIDNEVPEYTNRTACMFFPNLQDFDTKVFLHSGKKVNSTSIDQETIKTLSENILQHNKNENKCLLVFCDDDSMTSMHRLLDTLKSKNTSKSLSLIGGRTHDLFVCKYNDKTNNRRCKVETRIIVISISKPGMDSWSIIIKRRCYKGQQIVAKLIEFREKIKLQKYTCAIMFGCCARMDNKDVEMGAFAKVFPGVPLICGYGNEEYGVDTLDYKPTSKNTRFCNNYSTIFSIITYS